MEHIDTILTVIALAIGIALTAFFMATRGRISILRPKPKGIDSIGGKFGSSVVLKDFEAFCKDVMDGDYIFFYDPKVFIEHRKIPDRRKDLLHYNGTFYPMWDNKTMNNHNFIAIGVYDQYDTLGKYPKAALHKLDNLIRPYDLILTITQYTDDTGTDINKDKLLPIYLLTYNSNYEIFAYNTDKKTVYLIEHYELKPFLTALTPSLLKNLIYIGEKTYNVEYTKFPGALPWTFNWEGVRAPKDIVCTLPSRRTKVEEDDFSIPETFHNQLHKYPNRSKLEY